MSNEEQGIFQAQIAADQARLARGEKLDDRHDASVAALGEKVFLYVGVLAFIGLMVLWATAKSALLLYGSLAGAILLIFAWGWLRLKRIARIREQRARQAAAMQTDK